MGQSNHAMNQANSSSLRFYFPLSLLWEKLHSQAPGLPEDLQTPIKDDDINAIGSIKVIKLEGMEYFLCEGESIPVVNCTEMFFLLAPPEVYLPH